MSKTIKIIFGVLVIVMIGLVYVLTTQQTVAPTSTEELPDDSAAGGTMLNDAERDDDYALLTVTVAPYKKECVGVGPQQCLIVNDEFFYDTIEGFAFEEGFEYVIMVERIRREQPGAADQNQFRYVLSEVISKKDVRPTVVPSTNELEDTSWQWRETVYADESSISPVDPVQFSVQFGVDTFASTTDCNTLAGAYVVDGGSITIGPLAATKKACLEPTQEAVYAQMLEQVEQYYITDEGALVLVLDDEQGEMYFDSTVGNIE